MQRLATPHTSAWLMHLPQAVAAATNLAASTNYFLFRAPARMRVYAAQANVRTPVSGSSTTHAKFEFRLGRTVNDATPISDATAATGTVSLSGQPSDANTVTLSDGTTTKIFEFESSGGVSGGNVSVTIGADAPATTANLLTAIQGQTAFLFTAATLTTTSVKLTASTPGTAGNAFTLAKSGGNISVSAATFAGGTADGASGSRLTVGKQLTIAPGRYGSEDVEQTEQGFLVEKNQAVWLRCTSIGSTGTPAGLDVALTVGWAAE